MPTVYFFHGEPSPTFNFIGLQDEGPLCFYPVDPDEFLSGFLPCFDFE
jgi:hypothetical protein